MEVLYFGAKWCKPCGTYKPVVEKACDMRRLKLTVYDVEENPEPVEKFRIKGVPTVIVMDAERQEVLRLANAQTLDRLYEALGGV